MASGAGSTAQLSQTATCGVGLPAAVAAAASSARRRARLPGVTIFNNIRSARRAATRTAAGPNAATVSGLLTASSRKR